MMIVALHISATLSWHEPTVRAWRSPRSHDVTRMAPALLTLVRTDEIHELKARSAEQAVGDAALSTVTGLAKAFVPFEGHFNRTVEASILKMTRDMETIEATAVSEAQLGSVELFVLTSTVVIAAISPYVASMKLVEVLVPSMAALSAAIGISSEYTGKTAVSRGKEVAAVAMQAAAESEVLLAQAERAKAIIPLCVGIATTASAFSLLAPTLLAELTPILSATVVTEAYLISPLFAVRGCSGGARHTGVDRAVLSLDWHWHTEVRVEQQCRAHLVTQRHELARAERRLSATEQISAQTSRTQDRWKYFCLTVLPAPILGIIVPGSLAFRTIIVAAVAAAQAAYQLTQAEYAIAAGVEAVALKSRSAAVAETYANQGARAGAILPFTSALSGLCAATTVALVEVLPLISAISMQSFTATMFPAFGAVVAAAASVSKTRCELDADAANKAATELAFAESRTKNGRKKGPIIGVFELIMVTMSKFSVRGVPRFMRALGKRAKMSLLLFFGKLDSEALPPA